MRLVIAKAYTLLLGGFDEEGQVGCQIDVTHLMKRPKGLRVFMTQNVM